jgi:hypothetical protein
LPTNTPVRREGSQKKLLRQRNPEFPTVLYAIWPEVEDEAQTSAAPCEIATRVEITPRSGYTELNAGRAVAFRDHLNSRADGDDDFIGAVPFRFRLEKQD